jgi:hypothetical protein
MAGGAGPVTAANNGKTDLQNVLDICIPGLYERIQEDASLNTAQTEIPQEFVKQLETAIKRYAEEHNLTVDEKKIKRIAGLAKSMTIRQLKGVLSEAYATGLQLTTRGVVIQSFELSVICILVAACIVYRVTTYSLDKVASVALEEIKTQERIALYSNAQLLLGSLCTLVAQTLTKLAWKRSSNQTLQIAAPAAGREPPTHDMGNPSADFAAFLDIFIKSEPDRVI